GRAVAVGAAAPWSGGRVGAEWQCRSYAHRLRFSAKTRRRPQHTLRSQQGEQALHKLLGVLPAAREPAGEAGVGEHGIHPKARRALASRAIPIEESIDDDAPSGTNSIGKRLGKSR